MRCFTFLIACAALACSALGEDMKPYTQAIPGTKVTFDMVPIPGGRFTMGSPEKEAGRGSDEGPQFDVEIEPFWMGKCEVTWAEYQEYMKMYLAFRRLDAQKVVKRVPFNSPDAVSTPSAIYSPETVFEFGDDPRLPAVMMTQFAAKQYCKWLSKLTGHYYRLATEAEWEYACRAGTTTRYSFGDDGKKLGEYAWFAGNSENDAGNQVPHPVGLKKPNAWGLYDMHGNVVEWVLDGWDPRGYKLLAKGKTLSWREAFVTPTEVYPRGLRGGSFHSESSNCRSASRRTSNDKEWKLQDPDLPKSPWWFTEPEALDVGFRIIRPLHEPDDKEKIRFWDADVQKIRDDIETKEKEGGRGASILVTPDLPEKLKEIDRKLGN